MITVTTGAEMRRRTAGFRAAGERIGFVPTMGALHAGHLALVERARQLADRVVASVFVNPAQFDDPADLERYPRQPEEDARLLAAAGVDVLFLPPVAEVYPPGDATAVVVRGPAEGLEGAFRPGHFQGVATVVARLFHLVAPDLAVFGEKDAQQLAVVRRMVADLHVPVEIVAHPTMREADGLALSSRNARLDPAARRAATVLFRALLAGREAVEEAFAAAESAETAAGGAPEARRGRAGGAASAACSATAEPEPDGVAPAEPVRAALRRVLAAEPAAEVEYAEVVDAASFRPLDRLPAHGRIVLPLAVRLGGVRLIDNLQLDLPPAPAAGGSIHAARETSPAALS